MDQIGAYDKALREFDTRVHHVEPAQWRDATPCTAWSVKDLVNHVTGEHLWAPWLLRGATLTEVGDRFDGDVLGDDPVGVWDRAAAASREAFHVPGALNGRVHVTGGRIAAEDYGWQMIGDLTVHAWDLARGIGDDDRMDEDLAREVYDRIAPQASAWQGSGMFAPPVDVPDDAPVQDRLVALLGRTP
ncbi:TIGR03086 family metal-binding protein [Yinghuangia sp. ASG 101]|uniref:TIGR03086 family metal-binding protein n=1 Tax=Yinghuangia sp. ASG 101 TaxID=2896848 RepID=UPI001E455304|nr:TIGR03086 family metal-binding protein [Yinghuangia sp. ASG 101]UGQ13017.1 TIGR03086 family metal-binding protein [Yinghuangia sp. ASG 101]